MMNIRTRLQATICLVGVLLCGPLILGLSILGMTWSRDQDDSLLVLFVVFMSRALFLLGYYIIALTVWFGYKYLVEVKRANDTETGHILNKLTMRHKGKS